MVTLGIDWGEKRVGFALEINGVIMPLQTVNSETFWDELMKLSEAYPIDEIIIGLPLHFNGTDSSRSVKIRTIARTIKERTGKCVKLVDEKLTSKEAERRLSQTTNRSDVDSLSAAIILETYLSDKNKALIV